jgi:hypothetical protein
MATIVHCYFIVSHFFLTKLIYGYDCALLLHRLSFLSHKTPIYFVRAKSLQTPLLYGTEQDA